MKLFIFSFLLIICCISCRKGTEPVNPSGWNLQYENNDNITYYAIQFADEKNGWIVGYSGTIKKSADGGTTWDKQQSTVQSNLWDVCFINNQIGWICGADNTILKTLNAGKTWNKIILSGVADKINVTIKFIDENNGWLSNNHGEILKTSDGGDSWKIVKSNNIGGARLAVFDENTAYYLCGKLFRTFDGGNNWDSLVISIPKNYMISEMSFSDPNNGFFSTENGTGGTIINVYPIIMTNDGGDSWQSSDYLNSAGFRCVYFLNEKIGWVASNNIYKTNDGGKIWSLEYAQDSDIHGAKDMYFIDEYCGWLINYDGQIYKYEN